MINIAIEQSSVGDVQAYLERVKQRVLAGVRTGMQESMSELAGGVLGRLAVAGIVSHTGELAAAIEASPKVTETAAVIRGTVSADVGKKHLGLWFEEGTHVKAVAGNLYGFTEPDGKTFFTRGHKAFDVRKHPIMNPALAEMRSRIFQNIQRRANEAMAG